MDSPRNPATPLQSHQLVRRTIALVLAGGRAARPPWPPT